MQNETMNILLGRKSVRAYTDRPIPPEVKEAILTAAMRAPTAGNMMLYSIIDITDQRTKDILAETCDRQPFIARAPLLLLFLADYQRWYDYFEACGVPELCEKDEKTFAVPEESDLILAACDALIAAQTAVIAAESMGLGSCYIGDILENYETHAELFRLPPLAFPVTLLCFGYPTEQQKNRKQPERYGKEFIVHRDEYRRLGRKDFDVMFRNQAENLNTNVMGGNKNPGEFIYSKKVDAAFSHEMRRSVKEALKRWMAFQTKR